MIGVMRSIPASPLRVRAAEWLTRFVTILLLATCFASGAAHAEDEAEGRRLFKRGQELFVEGRYQEAAETFEAGYAAAPRNAFLINIAHSYRRAGELEKAKGYYLKLLEVEPNTPQRAEVEANIRSIDDALVLKSLPPTPPPAPAKPVPDADEAFRRRVAEDAAAHQQSQQRDDSSGSVFGKAWFWVLLGGVAAAGVAAFVLTRPEGGCPYTECWNEK